MKESSFLVAMLIGILPPLPANAAEFNGTWVSQPRSELTIVVGADGGRIAGPGWEHRFDARARALDFEIAPGRRLVLHRVGNTWVGEYFHPRIGPGAHERDKHGMAFSCSAGACVNEDNGSAVGLSRKNAERAAR